MSGSVQVANYVCVYTMLRSSGYHVLNFTAIHLQLYKIIEITRVAFFWHTV